MKREIQFIENELEQIEHQNIQFAAEKKLDNQLHN